MFLQIYSTSDRIFRQWEQLIENSLNGKEKYVAIKNLDLVGLGIFIFAKDAIKHRITRVSGDVVKMGFISSMANKGAVVVKMYLDDTLLCFSNVYLESGQKSLNSRLLNI